MRRVITLFFALLLTRVTFGMSAGSAGGSGEPDYKMKDYNLVTSYGTGFDFHSGYKMVYKDGYIYRAYASTSQFGWPQFIVFDVRNPEAPAYTYIGRSLIPDAFGEVALYDKYVYAISGSSLSVFDISIPTAPVFYKGVLAFEDKATDIEIQGKYAYVGFDTAYSSLTFRILDISNPLQPKAISGWQYSSTASYVNEMAVSGKYVYLSIERGSPNSFAVVDVSDPYNPTITTNTQPNVPSELREIVVRDNYLYGVSWFQSSVGLAVLDISNPANLTVVSSITLPNPGFSLYLAGNYAICGLDDLVDPTDTVRIVDISDPRNLKFITNSKSSVNNSWRSIVGFGQYVYLGGFSTTASLAVLKLPNIQVPAIGVGQLTADQVNIQQRLSVEKNIDVYGGLNVGPSGLNSRGPGVFQNGGVILSTESIVGISTPTFQNWMRASKNNGIVFTTGTANAWQYRRVDGATLVGD